jgi:hypothetical protein
MMPYDDVSIQLVDLPGLIFGAAKGKGMGKRFLSVIRNSDAIVIVVDASGPYEEHLGGLLHEFGTAGIRLNKKRPDVRVEKTDRGGINILGKQFLKFDIEDAEATLRDFGIINCKVRLNRPIELEDFIDAIDKSIVWKRCAVLLNKIDKTPKKDVSRAKKDIRAQGFEVYPFSVEEKINLNNVRDMFWDLSEMMRIYTKKGSPEPLVVPRGSSVLEVAMRIHTDFAKNFKYARVWGKSAKYEGQRVGKEHKLVDGDVIDLNA